MQELQTSASHPKSHLQIPQIYLSRSLISLSKLSSSHRYQNAYQSSRATPSMEAVVHLDPLPPVISFLDNEEHIFFACARPQPPQTSPTTKTLLSDWSTKFLRVICVCTLFFSFFFFFPSVSKKLYNICYLSLLKNLLFSGFTRTLFLFFLHFVM